MLIFIAHGATAQAGGAPAPAPAAPNYGGICGVTGGGAAFDQNLFNLVDADHSGTITEAELETAVTNGGDTIANADALYAILDPANAGTVTEAQFAQNLPACPAPAAGGGGDGGGTGAPPTCDAYAQTLFNLLDLNGDGVLTKAELEQALSGAGGSTAGADALFAELDPNNTGQVSEAQFADSLLAAPGGPLSTLAGGPTTCTTPPGGGGGTGDPGGGGSGDPGGGGSGDPGGGDGDGGGGTGDPTLPVDTTPPAGGCGACLCAILESEVTRTLIMTEEKATRTLLTEQFTEYQTWMVTDFFTENILPAMMNMAQTLTTVGMEQVEIFGAFLDAKQELETQQLFQSLAADAHKNYQPSLDLCTIGTAAINLGPAYRNAEYTADLMAQRSQQRQLGSAGTASANGTATDDASRLQLFKNRYCDISDNNNGFGTLCNAGGAANAVNRDIDYTRTIEQTRTLNMDFDAVTAPSNLTGDETDVMALDANLFSRHIFQRIGDNVLQVQNNQPGYLEVRSIVAKRSIPENSFFAIAGMRSAGSPSAQAETGPYVAAVLKQLGADQVDSAQMMGQRPSYYAMLDVMAQKIYQTPEFFVNLYDTPANVARKDVAMQAIDLMLDRDMYKSELRSEADMAMLLELRLMKQQSDIEGRLNWLSNDGKTN